MQKIFRRYAIAIITVAILAILCINFFYTTNSLENQQFRTFNVKIDQVIRTLENNQVELSSINRSLNREYLTRARIAAYLVKQNTDILTNIFELQDLATLLDVDELHVVDGNGNILHSSVTDYIGYNLNDGKQSSGFLSILDSDDKNSFVIQEAQPNSINGEIMQYVGVSRIEKKGIILIGLTPSRQMESQRQNTYSYIFSKFPTDIGESFFAIDCDTQEILGHSDGITKNNLDLFHLSPEQLSNCEKGNFIHLGGKTACYIVSRQYDNVFICAAIPKRILYRSLWKNVLFILFCLIIVEVLLILLLNYLVKRKVVDGVHNILTDLSQITKGNFDTVVDVGGNPEFAELSSGINTMVQSITYTSNRITKIMDMIEVPIAVFEYQKDMNHVFTTSKLRDLFKMTPREMNALSQDPDLFFRTVKKIMQNPVEGETDIFPSNNQQYIRIHLSMEPEGYMGVVTDVTKDVLDKRRIQYDNDHDQLTGLCRYRYFKNQSQKILSSLCSGICAFVMLDLDSFKSINDSFGHDVGDKYLQSFAAMMKTLPTQHCIVARRSGDEFCIFVYNYKVKEEIVTLLRSFWTALNENEVELSDKKTSTISVSGGFACTEQAESDISHLLLEADEALYEAKRGHKGRFLEYTPHAATP